MVENNASSAAGEASEVVVKKSKISMVWVVPLVVVILGALIVFKTIRDAGIPIALTFVTADGLEAGKTKIMFKNVEVGIVDTIEVSDDMTHVVLGATIHKRSARHLTEDTRFWVVRPRVTLQGISGLGTLLSGAFINIDPGTGNPATEFTGLEVPPVLELGSDARQFVLHAEELGSVAVGSPIIYRGFRVGEVLSYEMMDDDQAVEIKFFVREPHHRLVFEESRFWDVSGADVRATTDGIDVKIASMESLLIGGIAFETSKGVTKPVPAKDDAVFRLHRRHSDIDYYAESRRKVRFYFDGSLRGLSVGAPVEYKGIKVGEVTDISVDSNLETLEIKLPVTAVIEPERFAALGADWSSDPDEAARRLKRFIELGMRGQLATASLITGALFVDLVMEPDTPARLLGGPDAEIPEIPTVPTSSEQIMKSVVDVVAKLDRFMTKVDKVEIDKLVNSAAGAAEGLEKLLASEDLKGAVKDARELIEAARPAVESLNKLIADADKTLVDVDAGVKELVKQAEKTLAGLTALLAEDSPTQAELRAMLKEISGAARSLRSLTAYLERHPEALIKGKPGGK